MKAILMSIRPKWCALMMNGEKTVEVRKGTALYKAIQKLIVENGYADIYVYCTKGKPFLFEENMSDDRFVDKKPYQTSIQPNKYLLEYDEYLNGKVAFKFRCYEVSDFSKGELIYYKNDGWCGTEVEHIDTNGMCLTEEEIHDYLKGKNGCAIHISDLEIFDKPKELSEFDICVLMEDLSHDNIIHIHQRFKIIKAPQSWQFIEVK